MKKALKSLIPLAAMAALAALLLAGCYRGKSEESKTPTVEQGKAIVDPTKEDTVAAFNERMRHREALHGWPSRRESDK